MNIVNKVLPILIVALFLSCGKNGSSSEDSILPTGNRSVEDFDKTYYNFHPKSVLSLGRGFNANDLTQAKLPCFDFEKEWIENGALQTNFQVSYARNMIDLYSKLDIDTEVKFNYLAFSGNAEIDFDETNLFKQNTMTFVFSANVEFGRYVIKPSLGLTEYAKELTKDGFIKACGTHIPLIERRGASAYAIVTIEDIDISLQRQLKTKLNIGAKGKIGGSVDASLDQLIKSKSESDKVNIYLYSKGGAGISSLIYI